MGQPSKRTPPLWPMIGLFALAYWGTSTDPQYPLLLVEFLSQKFEVGKLAATMPIVLASFGAVVGTMLAGLMARRVGIGTLLHLSLWAFVLGSVLCAISPTLLLFDAARLFTGFFQGALALLFLLAIGAMVPPDKQGRAVGVISAGAMMAVGVVPLLIMATRPPDEPWRMPFWCFGGIVALAALGLLALRVPARPGEEDHTPVPWHLLRDRQMLMLVILGGVLLASVVAMGSQFTVFMKQEFDLDVHQLLPQMLTLGGGAVLGALVGGRLTDTLGPRPLLVWSSFFVAIFLTLVPWLAASRWAVYPVFFTMSALAALRVPPYQALMLHVIPQTAQGPLLAVRNMLSYVGTGVGAGMGGFLYATTDSYKSVAVFAGLVAAWAWWICWKHVPQYKPRG